MLLPENLVSTIDIASRLNVKRETVNNWRARKDKTGFPEPIAVISNGFTPVYDYTDVYAWFDKWSSTRKHYYV